MLKFSLLLLSQSLLHLGEQLHQHRGQQVRVKTRQPREVGREGVTCSDVIEENGLCSFYLTVP